VAVDLDCGGEIVVIDGGRSDLCDLRKTVLKVEGPLDGLSASAADSGQGGNNALGKLRSETLREIGAIACDSRVAEEGCRGDGSAPVAFKLFKVAESPSRDCDGCTTANRALTRRDVGDTKVNELRRKGCNVGTSTNVAIADTILIDKTRLAETEIDANTTLGDVCRSATADEVIRSDITLEGENTINVANNSVVLTESSTTNKEGFVTNSVKVVATDTINVWKPMPVVCSSEDCGFIHVGIEDNGNLSTPVEASLWCNAVDGSRTIDVWIGNDGAERSRATISKDTESRFRAKVVCIGAAHKVSEIIKGDNIVCCSRQNIVSTVAVFVAHRGDGRSIIERSSISRCCASTIDKEGRDVLIDEDGGFGLKVLLEEVGTVLGG